MNRAGEQGDAVPADLIAKVLTGDADLGGSGKVNAQGKIVVANSTNP
jgi:hypothetical protein